MAISRLTLTDFRNHADAVLTPGHGFVVLTGENGAGKTNVLEAVSLLAPGKGLRRASLTDMARQGGSGAFGVAARIEGEVDLGTGTRADAPERRLVRINGAGAPATALADWLTILWLTPAMDRIFVEAAGERRRFLDRLTMALSPAHARHTSRYEAAMRARNRLLSEAEKGVRTLDTEWLAVLESAMAEHGAAIAEAREEAVRLLGDRIIAEPEGPFARASLSIDGWRDEGRLLAELAEGRRRDAAAGRTLAGPHRSDLAVTHVAKEQAAALCSTGEQKALLLGIVLAHADLVAERVGRAPILLLDEVAAHLDPVRREALFGRLAGRGQVWMTGTEPALFDALPADATRYTVAGGTIA
ncbi:DNA replication/repair protein RecF [Stakelama pacifica]|uniref:DNA replication and repair protein RecF n=1 Tax=Stakelama pacifica TaxID=517720 RepID=A0A4R6FUK5_9SPHN|nr:DNA replication/repair protein RecF [Stakelama pacifica]TDN85462.1 DNA replication and repair protein RecF [Stakelama pacifica]GGO92577.1 DNA replication and repair protein RecF [Stakelama pacifica]